MSTTTRPNRNDPRIDAEVLEKILPHVVDWLEGETEGVEETLRELLDDTVNEDGYKLAAWLEDHKYWSPDARLVEILEDVEWLRYSAREKLCIAWVAETGAKPSRAIGDAIQYVHRGKPLDAVIAGIDEKRGHYVVAVPSLGHKPKGQTGTQGFIVEWEVIDAA